MGKPFLLTLLFAAFGALAGEVGVSLPPPTAFPDTECQTNLVLGAFVERTDVFSVALSLTATPSNNVELVFSEDTGDGRDSAFSIGWDCGLWFVEGPSNRFEAVSPSPPDRKTLAFSVRLDETGQPLSLSLAEGNAPLSFPGLPPLPGWIFSKRWDTLSVVCRGFGPTDPDPEVRFDTNGVSVLIR